MPFQKKSDFNFSSKEIRNFILARGLEEFKRTLEKEFFADVSVQCNYNTDKFQADLIIDLQCNFGLGECLHYYNLGNWGGFSKKNIENPVLYPFEASYQNLSDINKGDIDIAELSIHFNDTSLVITRIENQSIPQQLGKIISKINDHFVCLTKGHTEMPYEIFLPVFEHQPKNPKKETKASYFDYWGLYYENITSLTPMVYDLNTRKLYNEDFFLLD